MVPGALLDHLQYVLDFLVVNPISQFIEFLGFCCTKRIFSCEVCLSKTQEFYWKELLAREHLAND